MTNIDEAEKKEVKLNLGCGYNKIEGFINMDNQGFVNPDLVWDVINGLPFHDNSVDMVRAYDFLEHIPIGKTIYVIEEIYRVLKPNGILIHFTPSTDGRGAFQDPMHQSFWNINSWLYYSDDAYRRLYNIRAKFHGYLQDIVTSEDKRIIHTYGELRAVKE